MQLSLLDFGFVPPGSNAAAVLRQVVASAPLVESLGYSRFWLAEHHESHFCYACPEILIPQVAAMTSHIRVGSAGVLLHFHSPLKIAETFRILEALYPGRIDLGIASGITGNEEIRRRLRHGFDLAQALESRLYTSQVEELFGWCRNTIPRLEKAYREVTPVGQASPPILLLGGGKGKGNMVMAARHGTSFCYSLSHGPSETGPAIVEQYRQEFQLSVQLSSPHAMISGSIICAETNAEALAMQNYFLALDKGLKASVIGRPERCRDRIAELLDLYQCDEFVLMPMASDEASKIRAYEMLAEVCQLTRPIPTSLDQPDDAVLIPAGHSNA
jgi:luciferase family oxidoreductase group 1